MERELPDARSLLRRWSGRTITTVTGAPNTIIAVADDHVVVGTRRSPDGQPVPLAAAQGALDQLARDGEVTIDVETLGHRSAFCGAMLRTLAGVEVLRDSPPAVAWRDQSQPATPDAADLGAIAPWWENDAAERFWMEITDRADIGVDLPRTADIVFHYDRNARAVTAWSQAAGAVEATPTLWSSHRGATRRRTGSVPREQPGWWLDLEGPFLLPAQIPLAELRARGDEILAVIDALPLNHRSVYAPFYGYGRTRELRPTQYYLNKLPAELVSTFADVPPPPVPPAAPTGVGVAWRRRKSRAARIGAD